MAFKVLLVEDVKTIRTLIVHQLGELGVTQVVTAVDGTEALTVLTRELDIDLILSDWHMEPMDGLDFCGRIQTLPHIRGRHIPVVFMTNDERLADPEKRKRALQTAHGIGIVDMLIKPFSIEELRDVMVRCSRFAAIALSAA
ncbi:MAG: response regulator [Rhodospirillaceae bacterium]